MPGKEKKHDRHKRGVKLFFLPKFHGQKHSHNKNKYYVSHRDECSPERSIMSGDSPMHGNRTAEAFDFSTSPHQEGRPQLLEAKPLTSAEPVPTTSKESAIPGGKPEDKGASKGEVQASVLVEPGGKDKEDNDKDFGSPTLNNGETPSERGEDESGRRKAKDDDDYGGRDKKDRKEDKFRKNGNIDKLDGVWVTKDKKPQDEQEEDNCIVKCLYVTMTCCECSIM